MGDGRRVLLALSASQGSLRALEWLVQEYCRQGDRVTLLHIVCSLVQRMEVYHGIPGTSLGFEDPGAGHHEEADLRLAKAFVASRVEPVLARASGVEHETLYELETTSAPPSALAQLVAKHAEEKDVGLIVIGASHEDKEDGLGPVAAYCSTSLTRPLAIIR